MEYSIVYSSKTGNTEQLGKVLREVLPAETCCYYGNPDPAAWEAALIFVGFWTDKGNCDEVTREFLLQTEGKKVFLFGTAGFGGSERYYETILSNVMKSISDSNEIVGTFMCQGEMSASVRQHYVRMLEEKPGDAKTERMLANFNGAVGHPNEQDTEKLKQQLKQLQNM